VAEAVSWMKQLNKTASELAVGFGLRGGTDITGFGFLGHACEMAEASKVGLRIDFSQVPFVRGAQHYAREWIFPGGASDNRAYFGSKVHFAPHLDELAQMLLFDPQTSGGLMLAVPGAKLDLFLERAARLEQKFWVVGEVVEGDGIHVF
jgi:selenide,water dikinase